MQNSVYSTWNLKDIINELIKHHCEIKKIYLFGSRAYNTNSMRSDIDLLAVSEVPIPSGLINKWLHDQYPPVDLFTSYDGIVAASCVNGSTISYKPQNARGYANLVDQIDAILLWNEKDGFSDSFTAWNQQTLNNINFTMSIIPSTAEPNFDDTMKECLQNLESSGIKTFFAGTTWTEIAASIVSVIEAAFIKPTEFQKKARSFSFDIIKVKNEYDFQNIIHFLLRPYFRDIENENVTIRIDGADKKADFGVGGNKIIIEAKWIDSISKKADVIKTLKGLSDFYSENANVKCLIFLILYDEKVTLDQVELNYVFSYEKSTPHILVRFIKNVYC